MNENIYTMNFVEGIPGNRFSVGYRNQFVLVDVRSKEIMPLFKTDGTRNQALTTLELWTDEEEGLLLCFTSKNNNFLLYYFLFLI